MSHTVEKLLRLKLQNQLANNVFSCPGALFLSFSSFRANTYFHIVKETSASKQNYDFKTLILETFL